MIHIRAQSAGDRSQQRQMLDLFVLGFDQGLGSREDGAPSQEGTCRKSGQTFREYTGVCQHRGPNRWGPRSREEVTAELASPTTMAKMEGLMGRRV